jgi:hypothetical protein
MDRLDDRVRGCRQEATNEVRPRDRLGLRAPVTFKLRPTPSEGEQRAVFVEGEPDDVFFFVAGSARARIPRSCWLEPSSGSEGNDGSLVNRD